MISDTHQLCAAVVDDKPLNHLYPSAEDETQLYNLLSDPMEQDNTAEDVQAGEVLRRLQSYLECHVNATAFGSPALYLACDNIRPGEETRSRAGAESRRGWSNAPARPRSTLVSIASLVFTLFYTL